MRETDTLGGPLLPASLTNKVALAKARPLTPDNNDAGEGPDRDKGSDGATPRASLVRGDFPKRKSLSCLRTSMLPSLTGESFPRDSSASTVGQLPPLIDPSVPPRTSQPVVNSNPPSQPVANRDTSSHDTIVRPIPAYDDESGFSTPGSMEDGDGERRDRSHSFSHFDGEDQGDDTAGGRSTRSFSAAARVVVVANKMKKYRRSSAALHTDLLRAFVPDILINVSGFLCCIGSFFMKFSNSAHLRK